MHRMKMLGAAGALVVSALVGGTMVSAVLAAPATSQTTADVATNAGVSDAYLQTYLDTLASELGVDRAALGPAALAAANVAIDAAVSAGDMSADRATELKSQLAALDDPATLLAGHGAFGGPGDGPHGLGIGSAADAAATALGIDVSDLVSQMRDGSSLKAISDTQGVAYTDVMSAITDAVASDLATAVADGRITQDRADEVASDLQAWLDAGGQPGDGPFGFGHDFGHRGGPGMMGGPAA